MIDDADFDTGEYPPLAASPTTPTVRVRFGARSHPGLVRPNNEDHFVVARISRALEVLKDNLPEGALPGRVAEEGYAMVVADGMGGVAAGEEASMLAIRTGIQLVLDSSEWVLRIDDEGARALIARMRDYFQKVNQVL